MRQKEDILSPRTHTQEEGLPDWRLKKRKQKKPYSPASPDTLLSTIPLGYIPVTVSARRQP